MKCSTSIEDGMQRIEELNQKVFWLQFGYTATKGGILRGHKPFQFKEFDKQKVCDPLNVFQAVRKKGVQNRGKPF
jgi:hypothetical protein